MAHPVAMLLLEGSKGGHARANSVASARNGGAIGLEDRARIKDNGRTHGLFRKNGPDLRIG